MNRLAVSRCLRSITFRQPYMSPPHIFPPARPAPRFSSSPSSKDSNTSASPQLASNDTSSAPLSFIERAKRDGPTSLIGPFRSSGGFDSLLHSMTIERMDPAGHTTCILPLSPSPTTPLSFHNSHHKLHGGLHALLVDVVGTLALLARDGSRGGVSVDIGCQYLESVEVTDTLRCEGRVVKLGKRLGFTEVLLYRQSDGKLIATGKHIKAM